jgi:hypothetical protein
LIPVLSHPNLAEPACDPPPVIPLSHAIPLVGAKHRIVLSNLSESQSQIGEDSSTNVPMAKKVGSRNKFRHGCGPKFLQLVEAVKDGGAGGRRRRVRGGGVVGRASSVPALQGGRGFSAVGVSSPANTTIEVVPLISSQIEGLNLEVVLPSLCNPNNVGSLSQGSEEVSVVPKSQLGPDVGNGQLVREATTILAIQKQVGFSFTMDEGTVIHKLVTEEIKDYAIAREREQNSSY